MRINEGLDTGDMLLKWETEVGPEETAVALSERLAPAGAGLLVRTLAELPGIQPEPQDDSQATYAPILKKEDGHIDWAMSATEILNRIRGLLPWPGCYGFLRGQRFHIWKARPADTGKHVQESQPGRLTAMSRRLYAGCGSGAIELIEIQLEGKKRMEAAAFLNGFAFDADEVLG
jgi:methionyl-tRNA formyltransferase